MHARSAWPRAAVLLTGHVPPERAAAVGFVPGAGPCRALSLSRPRLHAQGAGREVSEPMGFSRPGRVPDSASIPVECVSLPLTSRCHRQEEGVWMGGNGVALGSLIFLGLEGGVCVMQKL